jgi:hypothetical protein
MTPGSALAAMAEEIRSFPERPVPKTVYGPDGVDLYHLTRKILDAMKRGSLLINVSEPNAQISINETGRGRDGSYTGDIYPGTYRLLIEVAGVSRRYEVTIHPGEQTKLLVDWATDAAFTATQEWTGFLLPEARPVLDYARSLAARLPEDDYLVVFGIDSGPDHRRWVSGSRVSCSSGQVISRAHVEVSALGEPLTDAQEAALRALAHYLGAGTKSPLVATFPHYVPDPLPADLLAPKPPTEHWSAWALAGGAVVTASAGSWLLLADRKLDCGANHRDCTPFGPAKAWGWGLLSSTAALAVLSALVYIETRYPTDAPVMGLWPQRSGATATMGWSF